MKYGKRYHHPMEWWTLTSVESFTVCGVPSSSTTASRCGKMNSLSSKCYFVFTILSIWLSLCLIKSNILLMVTSFLCLSSNRYSTNEIQNWNQSRFGDTLSSKARLWLLINLIATDKPRQYFKPYQQFEVANKISPSVLKLTLSLVWYCDMN